MRAIKFRGRNSTNWYYGDLIHIDKNAVGIKVGPGVVCPTNANTIGQFIGLKDKNGHDIFEGDVVRGSVVVPQLLIGQTRENSSTAMGGIVDYDHTGFIVRVIQNLCDPERDGNVNWFPFVSTDPFDGDFENIEVIGNIYDNPELQSSR